jgi:hypothetical protein
MSDSKIETAKKYHSDWIAFQTTPETEYWYKEIDYQAAIKRIAKLEDGIARESHDIEQSLGIALGYPWYKDDPKNFPDATEESGVCVGEHVPASIAAEAARRITELEAVIADLEAEVCGRSNEIARLLAENAELRKDKERFITDLRNRVKELNLKLSTCFPVSHQYTEIRARKEAFETVIAELEEGGEG